MNLRNGPDKSNSNRTAKAISAISIAGILIAVAFLSGLLSVIGSETAIAQQNLTATNATATNATATNATATNATATNATGTTIGNQTAAGNQTGTAATTGGNNTAGTTGVY
jgi:ABC-type lipoprotein release transport system permease subunit